MIRSGLKRPETAPSKLGACPSRKALLSARPNAALAQLVEHRIRNARVTCSSHVSGTRPPKRLGFFRKRRISAVSVPAKVHGMGTRKLLWDGS